MSERTASDRARRAPPPEAAEVAPERPETEGVEVVEAVEVEAPEPSRRAGPRGPSLTPRKVRAGIALLNGAPSLKAALLEAGYSPRTTESPTRLGLGTLDLLGAAEAHLRRSGSRGGGLSLAKLSGAALKRLRDSIEDRGDPQGVSASGMVLKLRQESDEPDDDPTPAHMLAFRAKSLQGVCIGLRLALRAPEQVEARLRALSAELATIRATLRALRASEQRQRHVYRGAGAGEP